MPEAAPEPCEPLHKLGFCEIRTGWQLEAIVGKNPFEYNRVAVHLAFQQFRLKLPNLLFLLL